MKLNEQLSNEFVLIINQLCLKHGPMEDIADNMGLSLKTLSNWKNNKNTRIAIYDKTMDILLSFLEEIDMDLYDQLRKIKDEYIKEQQEEVNKSLLLSRKLICPNLDNIDNLNKDTRLPDIFPPGIISVEDQFSLYASFPSKDEFLYIFEKYTYGNDAMASGLVLKEMFANNVIDKMRWLKIYERKRDKLNSLGIQETFWTDNFMLLNNIPNSLEELPKPVLILLIEKYLSSKYNQVITLERICKIIESVKKMQNNTLMITNYLKMLIYNHYSRNTNYKKEPYQDIQKINNYTNSETIFNVLFQYDLYPCKEDDDEKNEYQIHLTQAAYSLLDWYQN